MARLLLLRHAKAAWAEPGMRDFDRKLDATGIVQARAIGDVISAERYFPDIVICSAARRAQQTWEAFASRMPAGSETRLTDELYITDATGYLNIVRDIGDVGSLMIVGHNPMIEDVCFGIAPDGEPVATEARSSGFPTCGLAVIDLPGKFSGTVPGKGFLTAFHTPGEN